MSALCLATGALLAAIPLTSFTIAVTDTVDGSRREVLWHIVGDRFVSENGEQHAGEHDLALSRQLTTVIPHMLLSHAPGAPVHELCLQNRCRPLASLLPEIESPALIEVFPCPEPL